MLIQFLIGFVLLTTNIDVHQYWGAKEAVSIISKMLEIMDTREDRYVLTKHIEFKTDMDMLRARYKDLQNSPPLNLVALLPPRVIANELLLFNKAYENYLKECINLYPHNRQFQLAMEDTKILYTFWDAVRDAQCEYYYIHIRKQALKKVISMIGEEDFFASKFPPHVPLWAFSVVRH